MRWKAYAGDHTDMADDPEDFKPESWVDLAEIDDADATKVSVVQITHENAELTVSHPTGMRTLR